MIRSAESRRNIMRLTRRMVKCYCESLCMQDNTSFPHLTRMNNSGVRVAVRVNMSDPGEPKGMILSAATSFWLPLSPQHVFDYLIDDRKRAKVQTPNFFILNFNLASQNHQCFHVIFIVVGCSVLWKLRARNSTHHNR